MLFFWQSSGKTHTLVYYGLWIMLTWTWISLTTMKTFNRYENIKIHVRVFTLNFWTWHVCVHIRMCIYTVYCTCTYYKCNWPTKVVLQVPVLTSHTLMEVSSEPLTTWIPSNWRNNTSLTHVHQLHVPIHVHVHVYLRIQYYTCTLYNYYDN